ncbi:MAG: phosphoribosyl-ATP pyrophosphohydrolase [Gammaproteobacteria bacterium]|nr:MAG: phosphoribosyl-ATP pyrophosphohydrolase [Gammaproteobacteria bacterium]TND06268.1 MAG: phosphoribosyl-ATP pyrophosphohydrolase [Gammaproteobacteria bacterium]
MADTLKQLEQVLLERKSADPAQSYVAALYSKGSDAILQKIAEEAAETVIAGKGTDDGQVVHETADLWFHTLVLLTYRGIKVDDVLHELERRFGQSGLAEKAARK